MNNSWFGGVWQFTKKLSAPAEGGWQSGECVYAHIYRYSNVQRRSLTACLLRLQLVSWIFSADNIKIIASKGHIFKYKISPFSISLFFLSHAFNFLNCSVVIIKYLFKLKILNYHRIASNILFRNWNVIMSMNKYLLCEDKICFV